MPNVFPTCIEDRYRAHMFSLSEGGMIRLETLIELKLFKSSCQQNPVERFQATLSQSTVPSPRLLTSVELDASAMEKQARYRMRLSSQVCLHSRRQRRWQRERQTLGRGGRMVFARMPGDFRAVSDDTSLALGWEVRRYARCSNEDPAKSGLESKRILKRRGWCFLVPHLSAAFS